MLPGWQRVRAMSGPLIDIFGQYKAEYETVYR
jgi:hypothetical protein